MNHTPGHLARHQLEVPSRSGRSSQGHRGRNLIGLGNDAVAMSDKACLTGRLGSGILRL